MRKLMVLVAMLAMVLATAAPGFAQDGFMVDQEIGGQEIGIEDSISTNVNQVAANQFNAGDQNASADADADGDLDEDGDVDVNAEADASATANEFDVSTAQFNASFNNAGFLF